MPSTRSGSSYKPSNSSQKGHRCDYGRSQSDTEGQGQPEGLQQCTAAQRLSNPCRSVEELHELIPDCKKISGASQHLLVTQWIASIDGKEEYDSFNSRMEEKQPSTTKASSKTSPSGHKQQFQREKAATSSTQGQREGTRPKALQTGLKDAMENLFQMARTMMELQKEEARLIFQK
ncbi:hypothetical protein O181_115620 [Austropuccinia psidii MF-1]|uniref:Uncharacterized protein n=1 Tax=Austropuccinia psidii MF-1 TaxID=1389203 RepID=A0A9Q3KAU0_9BASI|nr:hypothetical protein [Austropuccinia psidii MF-1]